MGDAPIFDRYTKAKTVAFMNIEKKGKVMCADSVFSRLVCFFFYCCRMKLCKIDKNTTALHTARGRETVCVCHEI